MTQHFADIIATVTALYKDYAPANANSNVESLNTKIDTIKTANNNITATYGELKTSVDSRQNQYDDLSATIQRVKDAVKSQYSVGSSEYKLIKGLKV